MKAIKSVLFLSVLFLIAEPAHGNAPRAITGRDSLIIIFKGPTWQQKISSGKKAQSSNLFILPGQATVTLKMNHSLKPGDKMGNDNDELFVFNGNFIPCSSSFSEPLDESGAINYFFDSDERTINVLKREIRE